MLYQVIYYAAEDRNTALAVKYLLIDLQGRVVRHLLNVVLYKKPMKLWFKVLI
jgi:hypothetical protein